VLFIAAKLLPAKGIKESKSNKEQHFQEVAKGE